MKPPVSQSTKHSSTNNLSNGQSESPVVKLLQRDQENQDEATSDVSQKNKDEDEDLPPPRVEETCPSPEDTKNEEKGKA